MNILFITNKQTLKVNYILPYFSKRKRDLCSFYKRIYFVNFTETLNLEAILMFNGRCVMYSCRRNGRSILLDRRKLIFVFPISTCPELYKSPIVLYGCLGALFTCYKTVHKTLRITEILFLKNPLLGYFCDMQTHFTAIPLS